MSQVSPLVSVIIPVFNDSERLKICLEALEHQTYPKSSYEVIVIDNGSDKDVKCVVNQFAQARAAHESRPGSYAARNKGIALAQGEVIAFTDADCIPASDWIEKGVETLLKVPSCGLVAGRIELFFKDPGRPTAVELYEKITAFPQCQYVEKSHWGATANLFTFKSVIEHVGLFEDTLKSGGDVEWGQRVFSFGYKQLYAEDSCVFHPARYSFNQLYKKIVRVTGGVHEFSKKRADYPHLKIAFDIGLTRAIIRALRPPLGFIFSIYSDKKLSGNKQSSKIFLVRLYVHYLTIWERVRLQLGGLAER